MRIEKKFTTWAMVLLVLISTGTSKPRIGQSAINTLSFPWGARSLAMAETFTGIADNVSALYYNPAGLGQTPLAKTWIHSFTDEKEVYNFTTIAAKPNRAIADKEIVWALRNDGSIYKYNGSSWIGYTIHLLDSNETLREVAETHLDIKNYSHVDNAVLELRKFNNIGKEASNELLELISPEVSDESLADSLALLLSLLPVDEQNETDILGYIFEHVQSEKSTDLAKSVVEIITKPSEFEEMLEVKVPFAIGPSENIRTISVDHAGRLWVGAEDGVWRFDGSWKQYTSADGLPSDSVNTISATEDDRLIIGTDKGAVYYGEGVFTPIAADQMSVKITSAARRDLNTLFFATSEGLYKVTDDSTATAINSESELLNNKITSVMADSRGRIWVGGHGGVSIFDGNKWHQYQFKGSVINGFSEVGPEHYWIATDKGAVEFIEHYGASPEWKVHHQKNGLPSSEINSVFQFGDDTWLATGNGLSQFKNGEIQGTMFFEKLLPSLGLDDIWHAAAAAVVPLGEWGTVGFQSNYLYFGEVPNFNPDGSLDSTARSAFEVVNGLSYGLPIKPTFSLGLSLKYAYSRLSDDAKAHSISVDAALLKTDLFIPNLDLGFAILNMGPAVYYDTEQGKDPIPFTLRYGMSYKPVQTPSVELLVAFDLEREIVYVDDEHKPVRFYEAIWYDLFDDKYESTKDEFEKILVHTGLELTYAQLISARLGYMHDEAGSRKEVTFGLGLRTTVILADFGMIFTLGDNNIRNNQVRFSLTYAR